MTSPRLALVAFGLLATACSTMRPGPEPAAPVSAWIEIGPGASAQVRAITEATTCPPLTVDGLTRPMQVRAGADGGSFPVTVCEAPLPAGARSAAVAGQALSPPVPSPRRILVIGDNGCRMEAPTDFQACNDPTAWPFMMIVQAPHWLVSQPT